MAEGIKLPSASSTQDGLITTGSQSFAGAKTFLTASLISDTTNANPTFRIRNNAGGGGSTARLVIESTGIAAGVQIRFIPTGAGKATFANTISTGYSFESAAGTEMFFVGDQGALTVGISGGSQTHTIHGATINFNGNGATNPRIRILDTNTTGFPGINFGNSGGDKMAFLYHNADAAIHLYNLTFNGGSPLFTWANTGRVGLKKSAPEVGFDMSGADPVIQWHNNGGADSRKWRLGQGFISNALYLQDTTGTVGVQEWHGGGGVRFPSIGTTASAANAFLDSGAGNNLLRSTSSIRYKDEVVDLTSVQSAMVYDLRPITYRSKAEADDQSRRWFGFIAEEVNEVCPMLVNYNAEGQPDGVQYDRVVVMLVAEIKKLRERVETLENA